MQYVIYQCLNGERGSKIIIFSILVGLLQVYIHLYICWSMALLTFMVAHHYHLIIFVATKIAPCRKLDRSWCHVSCSKRSWVPRLWMLLAIGWSYKKKKARARDSSGDIPMVKLVWRSRTTDPQSQRPRWPLWRGSQ